MTEPVDKERRHLLVAASSAVLGNSLARCGNMGSGATAADVQVSQIPMDAQSLYSPNPGDASSFLIGRDSAGVYAFTNRCTHAACAVGLPKNGKLHCSCHNSEYNLNGDLTKPADGGSSTQPSLKHFKVTVTGTGSTAVAHVDLLTEETNRSNRTPVPA